MKFRRIMAPGFLTAGSACFGILRRADGGCRPAKNNKAIVLRRGVGERFQVGLFCG